MLNKLYATEIEYTKCFSQYFETDNYIKFWDDSLTDMWNHNYIYLKQNMAKDELRDFILKEIEQRRNENKTFFRLEANFPMDDSVYNNLSINPTILKYDYMYIPPENYTLLKGNEDCVIKNAAAPEVLEDGIKADLILSSPAMGEDFATRRIHRKAKVYCNPNINLNLYVCFHKDKPIGNCELFINGNTSKIEDFSVIDEFQRKGFGTSVIKHLLKQSMDSNVETAYLITDSADTAKDMYNKCGFTKVGEKFELFFSL
jgi:spore maturation protein CgeE